MLIKFDFSSKAGILVVKVAFATANLKIETFRMRRRFARVLGNCVFMCFDLGKWDRGLGESIKGEKKPIFEQHR